MPIKLKPPLAQQQANLEKVYTDLLKALGEDVKRAGLRETPRRAAAAWLEFINYQDTNADTTFEVIESDQMVVVTGIRVWSICEHHLLPFSCDLAIGVITTNEVLGLSKFARIAQLHAHHLQIQERLVKEIADEISATAHTPHVAVYGSGLHLCATMRGIKMPVVMKTSIMRGGFDKNPATRAEFLKVISLP